MRFVSKESRGYSKERFTAEAQGRKAGAEEMHLGLPPEIIIFLRNLCVSAVKNSEVL